MRNDYLIEHYGWRVFPVDAETKQPVKGVTWKDSTVDPDFWDPYWMTTDDYGIVTDGLLVIDVDKAENVHLLPDIPTDTLIVKTRRGAHIYFLDDIGYKKSSLNIRDKIDIKAGDGSYVIGPGSKDKYIVQHGDIQPISRYPEIVEWLTNPKNQEKQEEIEYEGKIGEGKRDSTLYKIGCSLRARGSNYEEILAYLKISNQTRCDPPLTLEEVEKCAKQASKFKKGDGDLHILESVSIDPSPNGLFYHKQPRIKPEPTWIMGTGEPLMWDGTRNILVGYRSSRKGLFALHGVYQYLQQGRPVLWIDAENYPEGVFERWDSHSWDHNLLADLNFRGPEAVQEDTRGMFLDWMNSYEKPGLVIFDSLTSLGMVGTTIADHEGVMNSWKSVVEPYHGFGHTLLVLAHTAKGNKDSDEATAYGSMAVETQADMIYLLKNKGKYSELRHTKDRRNLFSGRGEEIGLLRSNPNNTSSLVKWSHEEKEQGKKNNKVQKIMSVFEENDWERYEGKTAILRMCGDPANYRVAFDDLVEQGIIVIELTDAGDKFYKWKEGL